MQLKLTDALIVFLLTMCPAAFSDSRISENIYTITNTMIVPLSTEPKNVHLLFGIDLKAPIVAVWLINTH